MKKPTLFQGSAEIAKTKMKRNSRKKTIAIKKICYSFNLHDARFAPNPKKSAVAAITWSCSVG